MNLTDQQMELLRLLVLNHESQGGTEFYYTQSHSGNGVSYQGGFSIPVGYDASDFDQLRRERVISLTRIDRLSYRGKPTQLGITTVRLAFANPDDQALQPAAAGPAAEPRPFACAGGQGSDVTSEPQHNAELRRNRVWQGASCRDVQIVSFHISTVGGGFG
jgi:hypothetical protein